MPLTEIERIKKRVDEMYEHYGIDPTGMDEEDLSRVYKYYFNKKEELESDYEQSKKHAGLFDEDEMISIAAVEKITAQELNYEGKTSISFPSGDKGVYSIRKYESAKLSPLIADNLIVDRDGKVLKKEVFNDKPINLRIASLIKPLHTGSIYGGFSKLLYFLACLIATSLPITGTFIWIHKMKKKPKKE